MQSNLIFYSQYFFGCTQAKTSDNWKDTDAAAIDAEEISDSDDADAEPNNTEIENLNQVLWHLYMK